MHRVELKLYIMFITYNVNMYSIPTANQTWLWSVMSNSIPSIHPSKHILILWHAIARLSFAISAGIIKEKARVVAMDLRGHGKSSTENEIDMSIEVHYKLHILNNPFSL